MKSLRKQQNAVSNDSYIKTHKNNKPYKKKRTPMFQKLWGSLLIMIKKFTQNEEINS